MKTLGHVAKDSMNQIWLLSGYHINFDPGKGVAKREIKCVSCNKILHDAWSMFGLTPGIYGTFTFLYMLMEVAA